MQESYQIEGYPLTAKPYVLLDAPHGIVRLFAVPSKWNAAPVCNAASLLIASRAALNASLPWKSAMQTRSPPASMHLVTHVSAHSAAAHSAATGWYCTM